MTLEKRELDLRVLAWGGREANPRCVVSSYSARVTLCYLRLRLPRTLLLPLGTCVQRLLPGARTFFGCHHGGARSPLSLRRSYAHPELPSS